MSLIAFHSLYMALAINITDGRGHNNKAHHELLLKKEQSNVVLVFLFAANSRLTNCTLLTRWSVSVFKSRCDMRVSKLIKEHWPIVLS